MPTDAATSDRYALALAARIVAATLDHMARTAGVPLPDLIAALGTDGAARARLRAYLAIAAAELRSPP